MMQCFLIDPNGPYKLYQHTSFLQSMAETTFQLMTIQMFSGFSWERQHIALQRSSCSVFTPWRRCPWRVAVSFEPSLMLGVKQLLTLALGMKVSWGETKTAGMKCHSLFWGRFSFMAIFNMAGFYDISRKISESKLEQTTFSFLFIKLTVFLSLLIFEFLKNLGLKDDPILKRKFQRNAVQLRIACKERLRP